MQTIKKMVIAASLVTILVISGSWIYLEYFASKRLIISTTTSLYETGLLDAIKVEFKKKYSLDIHIISAGTGLAIQHAKNGDADVVLVHSPSLEASFLTNGVGICRKIVAYNFFAIIGPPSDPARINGTAPVEALQRIANYGRSRAGYVWVSRGDNSGTHNAEKILWEKADFNYSSLSKETWYVSRQGGMGETLMMADEYLGYTLTDMGTYLAYFTQRLIELVPLVTRGKDLVNVYSVIAVRPSILANQTLHSAINFRDSIAFIKYLVSNEGQTLIENYGVPEYGQNLFYGAAKVLKEEPDSEIAQWIRENAFINGTECPSEYRYNQDDLYG
ncbi:MAG: substrate-binding domain-containing protein [Candidatus Bathyarchaeia archaeon]|nr:substrate-binding domain-containing protein [Candidatus Bathyarchaeota archaeon]